MMARVVNQLIWWVFVVVGLSVFFSAPYYLSHELFRMSRPVMLAVALISSGMILWIALSRHPRPVQPILKGRRDRLIFLIVILAGVLLQAEWVALVVPVQSSDALDYSNTARRLVETGTYATDIGAGHLLHAGRPPGYPFFLAAVMEVFGAKPWVPTLGNILINILTGIVVFSMATQFAGDKAASLALLLLALWPSNTAMVGLAATEPLSVFLVVAGLWAFAMSTSRNRSRYAVLAGVVTGLSALVRSQLLILPAVWVLFVAMDRVKRWVSIKHTALAIMAMLLTIMPWAVRNYRVLRAFVPVSTNGGDVFYRANNPLATGGWISQGERRLDVDMFGGDEVQWNRTGFAWGMEWIKNHPLAFLKLALVKEHILLGKDDSGIRWSLKMGHNETGMFCRSMWGISDAWWIGVWALALIGAIRCRHFFAGNPTGGLMLSIVLFFVFTHCIFESQPRYHMPFVGILVVIAAMAVFPAQVRTHLVRHKSAENDKLQIRKVTHAIDEGKVEFSSVNFRP